MIVEVRPGAFSNKGGELMMRAVAARLQPEHRLAVEPWIAPFEARARLGLYQKLWVRRLGPGASLPARAVPGPIRSMFGIVAEREIGAVLDASGFRYSSDDRFGRRSTRELSANASRWRKQGKRIVLLPQALGPFEDPVVRAEFVEALASVDLVFARDRQSLGHLEALGAPPDKVRLAPDITLALAGVRPPDLEAVVGREPFACVIPNDRMVERTDPRVAARYVGFMTAAVKALRELELRPVLLLHETTRDAWFGDRLRDEVGGDLVVVVEDDPLRLKGIAGAARLVISSRFHGVVNALSQAVPVVATAWTHKYRGLLEDFGCPENLLDPRMGDAELRTQLERILSEPYLAGLIERLRERGATHRAADDETWRIIARLLEMSGLER